MIDITKSTLFCPGPPLRLHPQATAGSTLMTATYIPSDSRNLRARSPVNPAHTCCFTGVLLTNQEMVRVVLRWVDTLIRRITHTKINHYNIKLNLEKEIYYLLRIEFINVMLCYFLFGCKNFINYQIDIYITMDNP